MKEIKFGMGKVKISNFPIAILFERENRNRIIVDIHSGLKFKLDFAFLTLFIKIKLIKSKIIVAVPMKAKPS
jgi:hypothetical protein